MCFRLEGEAYIHYKSMLISLALHLILLMFELLVCDKLESSRHLWILVFIPLIFISVVSIAVCIWAVKHDRSFEVSTENILLDSNTACLLFQLELFCAVNFLQFIFLALRMDEFITWSWEVVFVPLWIVMCLSLVSTDSRFCNKHVTFECFRWEFCIQSYSQLFYLERPKLMLNKEGVVSILL